jgi:hypothetical protein
MTTATEVDFHPATPLARIGKVVKLNLVNPWTTITLPWIILGIVFGLNLAIWGIIVYAAGPNAGNVTEGLQYSGASSWIFVYMTIVAAQAINLTFPFAQGYGVTRRDFWLGTTVSFLLLAAMYTIGMTILSVLEEATSGWGLSGRMFTAIYFGDVWYERMFIFFALFAFFFFLGAAIATVYLRWKATGITMFFAALGLLIVAGLALITFTESWVAVGEFFVNAGLVGSFAWSFVITAIAWVAGFLILQRATPKN